MEDREKQLVADLKDRQERLQEIRRPTDALWDDLESFILPRRNIYRVGSLTGENEGERPGSKIYDSTAAAAGQDLADGFQGNSASPTIKWNEIRLRSKEAMSNRTILKWFEEVQEAMGYEWAQSNFYEMLNQAAIDAIFYGPATMSRPIWDNADNKLVFMTFHPREIFFARDFKGKINLWHRRFPITGREIIAEFGKEKLTDQMVRDIDKNPYREYDCVHAVYLRTERDVSKLDAKNKKIASVYFLPEQNILLREKGFSQWPVYTWCWRTDSASVYPRSVAIDVINDAMTLNAATKSVLKSAQLALEAPIIADESLKGKIRRTPNGITFRTSPNETVSRLIDAQSNYPIGIDEVRKMQEELRRRFKADTFTMLSTITKQMTAMEASEIMAEKAALLGPLITRNQGELLTPQVMATFKVLAENGRLPKPPAVLAKYLNSPLDIQYLGPVALATKRYMQMQGLNPALQMVAGMKDIWPEMLDGINPDKLRDFIWISNGAPQSVLYDDEFVMQLRQQRAQQQEQLADMAKAQAGAEQVKNLSKAPEEGSPAQRMVG